MSLVAEEKCAKHNGRPRSLCEKWHLEEREAVAFKGKLERILDLPEMTDEIGLLSVVDARAEHVARFTGGEEVICVVCGSRCHIDGRPFDLTLARALNYMRQRDDKEPGAYFHMADALNEHRLNRGNVAAMMRHWNVIQAEDPRVDGTDRKGCYRITPLGREFLAGQIAIPLMSYTHQGKLFSLSDNTNPFEKGREEYLRIAAVKEFDYDELFLR